STAPMLAFPVDSWCTLGLLGLFRPGYPLGYDIGLDTLLGQAVLKVQQPWRLRASTEWTAKITMDETMPMQPSIDDMKFGDGGVRHGDLLGRQKPGVTCQSHQASLYSHSLEGSEGVARRIAETLFADNSKCDEKRLESLEILPEGLIDDLGVG